MTSLEELRRLMDQVNGELKSLLLERLRLAKRIMALKQELGQPPKDPGREGEILKMVLTAELSAHEREYLKAVFESVFSHTGSHQA